MHYKHFVEDIVVVNPLIPLLYNETLFILFGLTFTTSSGGGFFEILKKMFKHSHPPSLNQCQYLEFHNTSVLQKLMPRLKVS